MSKTGYVIGGTLIGVAGGIYLGASMTCRFMGCILRQGGEEKIDEVFQILRECNEKRKESPN